MQVLAGVSVPVCLCARPQCSSERVRVSRQTVHVRASEHPSFVVILLYALEAKLAPGIDGKDRGRSHDAVSFGGRCWIGGGS